MHSKKPKSSTIHRKAAKKQHHFSHKRSIHTIKQSSRLSNKSLKSKSISIQSHIFQISKRTWLGLGVPVIRYPGPKKTPDELYELFPVSPIRHVPGHIQSPPYVSQAQYGTPSVATKCATIKTDAEIEQMRKVCSMASYIRQFGGDLVRPGVTTDEIDEAVHNEIIRLGAYPSPLQYHGFPKSLCSSVNNVICHGIPDARPLKNGDIINLDITLYYDGFHGDCSGMFIAGETDENAERLIFTTKLAMNSAIQKCHPGQQFKEIGIEVQRIADLNKFGINTAFSGHGIGRSFHEAPEVMNCRNSIPGTMHKNMTFTVEPILNETYFTDYLTHNDNWTVLTPDGSRSAQFEETIRITDNGVEILTQHKPGYFEVKS